MSRVSIRPATPGDFDLLATDLREHDKFEIRVFEPKGGIASILHEHVPLENTVAGRYDDELVIVFGTVPTAGLLGGDAIVWALSTSAADKYPRQLARASFRWIVEQQKKWDRLHAYVDIEYDRSIRWLAWMGFELRGNIQLGPDEEFYHMVRES